MNVELRSSWRRMFFIGLLMFLTSSCTGATGHHLRHVLETTRNRIDAQNSWNHDGSRRRAEGEADDFYGEDSANSGTAYDKVSQMEQTVKQEFLYMFDNPPSEWTMQHWCVFAGMALLVVVIILWWFMACVIPTCCPKPKYIPEDEIVDSYELYTSTSVSSIYTESESEEESKHKYKEQNRADKNSSDRNTRQGLFRYTHGKNGKPPTFAC